MSAQAIFLSYSSDDSDAARRICEALRAAGLEVWFDQSELRGGDAWDQSIRKQIKECALFVPVISANTNAREEGYFRLEWKLAVDRSHLMADDKVFFFPVILGDVAEPTARVPDKFRERQWTRLYSQESFDSFAARLAKVLDGRGFQVKSSLKGVPDGELEKQGGTSQARRPREGGDPVAFDEDLQTQDPRLRGNDEPTSDTRIDRSATRATKEPLGIASRPRFIAIVAVLALIAAALFGIRHFTHTQSSEITSIAVLPFQAPTTAADPDTDYLAVGLAETLIYQFSRLPKFKVSPASSVYRYKGKEVDPLKVGADLGVDTVMTGRLAQRGESLSISVELVDVRNNKSLWGERYERKIADLLATQRDIATEIARKLQLNLLGDSPQLLAKRFTDNNEAYQLYLKGKYQYGRRGKEALVLAVDLFQNAIKLDPNFAMAYVALVDAYSIAVSNRHMRQKDVLPLASAAAKRALAIDPTLAEAHSANASVAAMDWRWEEARQGFTKAIELNPAVAEIRYRYGVQYLMPMGRNDDAIAELNRAASLEPQSTIYVAVLTRALLNTGKTQLALQNAKRVHAFDPDHVVALYWLPIAHAASGHYTEALAIIKEQRIKSGQRDMYTGLFAGWSYVHLGKLDEAKQELAWLADVNRDPFSAYSAGLLAGAMGKSDQAFALLERAFVERDPFLIHLRDDHFAVPLRGDPRFARLVKRMGLPP